MNLQEDYCSFEISELLREKGFDGLCHRYDFEDWRGRHTDTVAKYPNNFNKDNGSTSIPTHQMAMKWLREKHKLFIDISFQKDEDGSVTWFYMIWALDNRKRDAEEIDFTSYEEAVEAALKYCLTKLI